jgi:hypothetical protein
MVKIIGLIVIFLSLSEVTAQKVLQKIVDAQNVEQISINGDGMFKIEVISEARNTIEMISEIEGEYAVNTMLNYTVIGEVLSINNSFSPYFKKDNDKLAVHKVESVSLKIKIPYGLVVRITSDIANLKIVGTYVYVDVSLENGNCIVRNFIGNANLVTSEGDITVEASGVDVSGTLFSKLGKEINELPDGNRYMIEAYSLRGNIELQQIEK